MHSYVLYAIFEVHPKMSKTRANNLYLPYRTSSQSSPLHNQPSWTFKLLHATFQQNDSTNYSFSMTLWPWVNIKIIQTGIKLRSLVVSSIIPSLKQIGLQVSWHRLMLNISFTKSCQQSSFPWILHVQNKFRMRFNKPTGCDNRLNLIQMNCKIYEKMDTKVFNFSCNCDLEWRSGSSKLILKCKA